MSSDERNMERERFGRDVIRAGFVEVKPGEWVRVSAIAIIGEDENTGNATYTLLGRPGVEECPTEVTPAQLLRAIVAGRQLP